MKRLLIIGLISLLIVVLAIVAIFSRCATRPTLSSVDPISDNEQIFSLATKDNVTVAASFFETKNENAPIILLLHGNGASRSQFSTHIEWLNQAGFSAMAIDFRGHGESQEESKSFGLLEANDVAAALGWINSN